MTAAVARTLAGVLSALVLVAPTSPADADTPGCVTRAELRAAKHGLPKPRVHNIFDTRGTRINLIPASEERRTYRMCDPSLRLNVVYLHGRLGYKKLRTI